ncbi:nitrate regulatory gene2 protein-like [Vicia villosa]|uniref:nitrate regulatory gene2 protein-like n=1 Tax=Vicia villosa TaxID=3911 RepID=UPI00273A83C9|nr:nitrate regulatory gene2 protein-like [Vicia villosa]
MKEAVYARHHLAAAHSDYCRSLRLTGTALSTFSAGEPLSVSDNTPAVFINHKTTTPIPSTATKTTTTVSFIVFLPPPSSSAATVSTFIFSHYNLLKTPSRPLFFHSIHQSTPPPSPPKLPHILSDSSPSSTHEATSPTIWMNYTPRPNERRRLQRDMLRRWGNQDDVASSLTGEGVMETNMVVKHRDLKENFDKAAVAGDQISEMLLEISKAQPDRTFRQLRKTVYHSNSLLSSLSSTWTSKPTFAVKYRLEPDSLDEPGGLKSLCSSLEQLLAWEKKLYDKVKSKEGVKIEHEKKLSALQSQEYKGEDEAKIFKTNTSINKLQSLIVVRSQFTSCVYHLDRYCWP